MQSDLGQALIVISAALGAVTVLVFVLAWLEQGLPVTDARPVRRTARRGRAGGGRAF